MPLTNRPPPALSRNLPSWAAEFVLLAALWGSSFLFMRLGAAEFGPLPTAGLRVGMATVFLMPLMLARGHGPALRQHMGPVLLAGVINSAIPFALFSYAVLHIATGLTSVLNATVPLFGALVAWLWLGDRPGATRWLGTVIGFLGVALLAWDEASFATGSGWAVLACLGATLCYGIAASYAKRYLTGVPPLATATGSQLGAALALALPTVWFWPMRMPGLQAWAAIATMALLCTALAYVLYFRLIEKAGPSKALTVTFLTPVFALAYGSVFLGEPITPWMVGAGLVIVCGTLLSTGLVGLRRRDVTVITTTTGNSTPTAPRRPPH